MRALFAVLVTSAFAGCSLFDDSDRTVVMPVEEIRVAEVARAGEPLAVTLVGLLTDGCQRFERVDAAAGSQGVTFTMTARKPTGGMCNADIRRVERTREVRPRSPGTFVVRARQRDGSVTEQEVRVE